jgi:hypothetical protein
MYCKSQVDRDKEGNDEVGIGSENKKRFVLRGGAPDGILV